MAAPSVFGKNESMFCMLRAAGDTHPGCIREHNEDRIYCDAAEGIFIVIDGLGGHMAGEVAARIAFQEILQRLRRQEGTMEERIREAITLANNEIYKQAQDNVAWQGMACVLTVVIVQGLQATIGHVGDTRLYKIHGGTVKKLTQDHSLVGRLENAGKINEAMAMNHPLRNYILREVGSAHRSPYDQDFIALESISFEPDGALVLCSDGLSDVVTSEEIRRVVAHYAGVPEQSVAALIELANSRGGPDNISVIIVEGEAFEGGSTTDRQGVEKETGQDKHLEPVDGARPMARRWPVFIAGAIFGLMLLATAQFLFQFDNPLAAKETPDAFLPRTIFVAPDSAGVPTLRQALEHAQPGALIEAAPGVYEAPIRLKDGVYVVSQRPREAIIRTTLTDGEAVIADGLSSGRFVGFKIEGREEQPLPVGIRLIDANIAIEDVEISGTDSAGILISGTSRATLRANFIHSNRRVGVAIEGAAAPRLVQNVLLSNGKGDSVGYPGVDIAQKARPVLTGNLITDSGAEGIRVYVASWDTLLQVNFFRVADFVNTGQDVTVISQ